ncbi:MAG: hypothetical protein OHK0040_07110 [bacterium]
MQDNRRDPRVPLKLKVKLKRENFEGEFYTANVSRGGIFVETPEPFSLEDVLDIELFLNEEERIVCKGKVVWLSHENEKSFYLPGMGLKFEDITLKDRERLGQFLGEIIIKEQEVDEDFLYDMESRILVSSDDICETNADAIIVFAGRGIKEQVNFTKEVLKNAGEKLKSNYLLYGDDLNEGETILVPYEGKLKNPYIILVGIPSFYDAYGDQKLRNTILNVLKVAKEQAFPAIAVPAFSLLEIGYPLQNVAKVCLGTTYGFLKKEIFPRKVFFYSNYNNVADLLVFQRIKKEIFSS